MASEKSSNDTSESFQVHIPNGLLDATAQAPASPNSAQKPGPFIVERVKENPFVFLGLGVTVGALVRGVTTMTRGDEIQQNRMMRLRIAGQAFTVFAFVAGCALGWHGPVIESVEKWKMQHGYSPHPLILKRQAAALQMWTQDEAAAASASSADKQL